MTVPISIPLNRAKELVKKLYLLGDRQSILWLGAPGIGKSESIKQIAMELAEERGQKFVELSFRMKSGSDYTAVYDKAVKVLRKPDKYFVFTDIRLTEFEPVDLLGVPREFVIHTEIDEVRLFDYQPFIWQLVVSACAGTTLLDEITNIHRSDMRSVTYKMLRDRMTGWVKFHPDQLIIAAGNTPEDAAIATMLDAPVINRVRVFRIEPPTVDEWAEYMNKYVEDWDTRVYAFLKRFPQYFYQKPEDVETLDPFPTPRQWTELARVSKHFNDDELEILAYANVGSEAAAHFITFVRTKIPDVKDILTKPEIFASLEVDGKYLAASVVAAEIARDFTDSQRPNLAKYVKLLTWLLDNDREILQLIAVMAGNKAMRKLHTMCLMNVATRPVAKFFAETTKMLWEAGL